MRTFAKKSNNTQQTTSAKTTIPGRTQLDQNQDVNSFHIQRTIESHAVQRLLEANTRDAKGDLATTETARFGWDFSAIPAFAPDRQDRTQPHYAFIQPKLGNRQADDALEREADRIADHVMLLKNPDLSIPNAPVHVSPKVVIGKGKDTKTLQKTHSQPRKVDDCMLPEIRLLQGGGSPLPQLQRSFFESRFGYDFTKVRIHSDSRAAGLARRVNARAFTLGQDIVFGAGQYSPKSGEGTRLLAHELVHVVQQQTSPAFIQRQRQPGYFDPGGVASQLDILLEGESLPFEFYKRPDIRKLSSSERTVLSFKRKLGAIIKLGDLRHKNAVNTLIKIVENKLYVTPKGFTAHQKRWLQQEAVTALGKIGTPKAIKKLSDMLNSKDPKERSLAARGLSVVSGKTMPYWQVVPAAQAGTILLTKLKQETDPGIKSQIIVALGNVGSHLSSNQAKQTIVTELIDVMKKGSGNIPIAAIKALGRIRLKSATDPLLKQLRAHTSINIMVQEIIFALGEIRDVRAVDSLVIFLKHGSKSAKIEAAIALGKIGGAKALAALKKRLTLETDVLVKAAISKAIP